MQVWAICLVRDEADVIADCLRHAASFCDRILVIDNGSVDGTDAIVAELARTEPRVELFARDQRPYGDGLRAAAYNACHAQLTADDWWLVLDADEFLVADPRPVLAATASAAEVVWAWQAQFYFTDVDLAEWSAGRDSRARPVTERRRFYAINWQEPRLFRNRPDRSWDPGVSAKVPDGMVRRARQTVLNRHYQFRDPPQMAARIAARYGVPSFARHVRSPDWRDYLRPARKLLEHHPGGPLRQRAADAAGYVARWSLRRLRRRLSTPAG